jgi:hypothetical protein
VGGVTGSAVWYEGTSSACKAIGNGFVSDSSLVEGPGEVGSVPAGCLASEGSVEAKEVVSQVSARSEGDIFDPAMLLTLARLRSDDTESTRGRILDSGRRTKVPRGGLEERSDAADASRSECAKTTVTTGGVLYFERERVRQVGLEGVVPEFELIGSVFATP